MYACVVYAMYVCVYVVRSVGPRPSVLKRCIANSGANCLSFLMAAAVKASVRHAIDRSTTESR